MKSLLRIKALYDQVTRQKDELAQWNRTLEQRVAEGVGRLERFFSPQLAEAIVAGGADDPLKSHRREITVVFLDLRGFTAFTDMRREMNPLAVGWKRRGDDLRMGVGVAQGFASIGGIGFPGRIDYGAIGTANLAARLCGEAQGGEALLSQRVMGTLDEAEFHTEPAGELTLEGFARPVAAFRLLAG